MPGDNINPLIKKPQLGPVPEGLVIVPKDSEDCLAKYILQSLPNCNVSNYLLWWH